MRGGRRLRAGARGACLASLALVACRAAEPEPASEGLPATAVELHATCAPSFDPAAAEHGRLRIEARNTTGGVATLPQELWLEAHAPWLRHSMLRSVSLGARASATLAPGATAVLLDQTLHEVLLSGGWDWPARSLPPASPIEGAARGADGVAHLRLGAGLDRGGQAGVEVELAIEAPARR